MLRNDGYRVLYKAGSMGTIEDQPAFECWRRDVLRARYPKVARNTEPLTAEVAALPFLFLIRAEAQLPVVTEPKNGRKVNHG